MDLIGGTKNGAECWLVWLDYGI